MTVFKKFLIILSSVAVVSFLFFTSTHNKTAESSKFVSINSNKILVEVADTERSRQLGLSVKTNLEQDKGMLFDFGSRDVYPVFWMKDMVFPIDIIWINDGKIVKIDKDVPNPLAGTPDSALKLYNPPDSGIDYVLEVNAGYSDKNEVKVGDNVTLPND